MLPLILFFASLSQAQDNTPLPLPSIASTTSITVPWSSIPTPSGTGTGTVWSSTSAPTSAPAASGGGGGGGDTGQGAVCGRGFTYCGYILRDHQGFAEADIVKSYCSASKENCLNGKTKTDPIQALYVCVPPDNSTSTTAAYITNPNPNAFLSPHISPQSNPYANSDHGSSSGPSSFFSSLFGMGGSNKVLHPRGRWSTTKRQSDSGGGVPGNNGVGGGDSCSKTDTPGNKIELLCSCGGSCLDPDRDHIGRCDAPCN